MQRRDFQSFSTIWCGGGRMRQKDAKFLEVEKEGELLGGSVKYVKTENVWKVLFLFLICKHNWNERWSQQMRIWAKQDNSPARWQTTTAENSKQITNMWKWNYYILPISSCTNNNLVILDCKSDLLTPYLPIFPLTHLRIILLFFSILNPITSLVIPANFLFSLVRGR